MKTPEKEAIKEVLDCFIALLEINELQAEKEDLVRQQRYEDAARIRSKEFLIRDKFPDLKKLKKLRAAIK